MNRRKYIFVAVAFLMMFVGILNDANALGGDFSLLNYNINIITTGNDDKTNALQEEVFDVSGDIQGYCDLVDCTVYLSITTPNYNMDDDVSYNISETSITCSATGTSVKSINFHNVTKTTTQEIKKILCKLTIFAGAGPPLLINTLTTFNTTAHAKEQDTTEWWVSKVNGFTPYGSSQTSILAPKLEIKEISKTPSGQYAYINTNFTWDVNVANNPHQSGYYTGKAFGVYSNMTYNETAFTNISCNPENISHGDIDSGDSNTSGCMFSANTLGTYYFDTNLSDWSGYYYPDWTGDPSLNIVNLTVNGSADDTTYGSQVYIQATVKGIASNIESVTTSWNYTRINGDTGELEIAIGGCDAMGLQYYEVYPPVNHYECYPIINSSGRYNVTFNVLDEYGEYNIEATNTTTFDVGFGIANITDVAYNMDNATALILKNQTFNITTFIDIQNGDVWGLNISIESSNPEIINVSNIANQTYVLGNMQSWDWTNVTWYNIYANNSGLVKLTIKTTALNGTGTTYDKYPQIVDIIVDVKNETLNVEDTQEGQVKFSGNFSNTELLNLTFKNEFGLFYNKTIDDFYTVDADECYKLEGESHNVALPSYGASAVSGGGAFTYEPNASIDDNPSSNWYGYTDMIGPTELNITFNETQILQGIQLLWNDNNGNANVSVYYYYEDCESSTSSESGGILIGCISIEEEIINNYNPPNTTNTTIFEQIRAGVTKIRIIQSANNTLLNIYSLEAYTTPVTDYEPPCMIYNFTYEVPRSGTYQIAPEITLNKSRVKRTNANNFFVYFGQPQLIFNEPTWLINSVNTYQTELKAVGGDIYNITINLTIENETVVNYTLSENMTKNISNVYYNDMPVIIEWNLNTTYVGNTTINLTANSTTLDEMYVLNASNITVILEDNIPPIVNNYWFNYNETNATNLYTPIIVYINATDNETSIKNITINITRPNMDWFEQVETTITSGDVQIVEINSSKLNETGAYTLNISVFDLGSNIDYGNTTITFNTTNKYHIKLASNYSIFMRGENITISLLDINNNTVLGANWTVNLTKYNETEKNVLNETTNLYTYEIKTNDTDGNYSIFVNATKYKNYVYSNHTFSFNTSSKLLIYLNTTFDFEYDSNANLPYFTSSVYTIRNVELIDTTTTLNYNSYIEDMNYISGLFRSLTQYKAPATSNTIKTLTINASDINNNTGILITNIKTKATTPPGGGGGGGSSSSSSSGFIPTPTNVTENKTPEINFEYKIANSERRFLTGYSDTVMATITNIGDTSITVYSKISPSPINITMDNNFTLDVGADKSFKITLYANLSINPGIYYADIILYNENLNLEKIRTLKMIVNENDYISDFNDIKEDLDLFELELVSFENVKINTSIIRKHTEKIQQYFSDANLAIKNDKMDILQFSVDNARAELNDAKLKALPLKTTQFIFENKWALLSGGMTTLVLLYILLYLIIPYTKISNRIRKLTRLEKIIIDTRKATEKKYFMRQLNEMTFNKIMADEENKLLKFKSEVNKLKQEKHLLLHLKLGKIKQLESDKKKEKERVKKEIDLKNKAKRKMSDIIVEHDMGKKKTFWEYFGYNKKHKEFVFDNTNQKSKTDVKKPKEKTSLFSKLFKHLFVSINKTNNSDEMKKNISIKPKKIILAVKDKTLKNRLYKNENNIINTFPAPVKKESFNANTDSTKIENISIKDNISNINEQLNEQKKEKTLYSTNNKENIKEEINKIKKMLRGINDN